MNTCDERFASEFAASAASNAADDGGPTWMAVGFLLRAMSGKSIPAINTGV